MIKLLGGTTAVMLLAIVVLTGTVKLKNKKIDNLKQDVATYSALTTKLSQNIDSLQARTKEDILNHSDQIKGIQSTIAQVNNKNKALQVENANLRKGVRIDLLKVRVRRNGSAIDSVYTQGYKYSNK
jgi:outer membrane murein-binding lipoprotein Lpp